MSPSPKPSPDNDLQPAPAPQPSHAAAPDDASVEQSIATQESADQDEELISVEEHRPEGYEGSCLRPMGLCTLGGCCDLCWYGNPQLRRAGEPEDKG